MAFHASNKCAVDLLAKIYPTKSCPSLIAQNVLMRHRTTFEELTESTKTLVAGEDNQLYDSIRKWQGDYGLEYASSLTRSATNK